VCEPTDNVEIVKVATPLLIVPVPKVEVPSLKFIEPVVDEGVIRDVNVTGEP
jgi:hypothetical protein